MKTGYRITLTTMAVTLLLTALLWLLLPYWLPSLLALWLPASSRIVLTTPQPQWRSLALSQLHYLVGDCELARVNQIRLSYSQSWRLDIGALDVESACFSKLPQTHSNSTFSLPAWPMVLPSGLLHIRQLTFTGYTHYAGSLTLENNARTQQLHYQGEHLTVNADLHHNQLSLNQFSMTLPDNPEFILSASGKLIPDGKGSATRGQIDARLHLPEHWQDKSLPASLSATLTWQGAQGLLLIHAPDDPQPLLDLPWQITAKQVRFYDGRWQWQHPLSAEGRLSATIDHWQNGLDQAVITARLSVLTQGKSGKGNSVLTLGPGHINLADNPLPVQLTGQANYNALQLYASLPGELTGNWQNPALRFLPGALLRSRGQLVDGINIEQIRWPLAGVTLSQNGVNGRLQAILRGSDASAGTFSLHLDGKAQDFLPDRGLWQWHYWGQGDFLPTRSRWLTRGNGEWRDDNITVEKLISDVDQLNYASLHAGASHLSLKTPLVWQRNASHPRFTGELILDAATIQSRHGGFLPASVLNFTLDGKHPDHFAFRGHWQAAAIGPVRLHGSWNGTRLRGEGWWPVQPLDVFQPLFAPALKIRLQEGEFYAQVAFSAAAGQGLLAGGHGVVKNGSGWLAHHQVSGADFILPFRFANGSWRLGPYQPVTLRVKRIDNPFHITDLTADLQGWYPWNDRQPLTLSNMSLNLLGGNISMWQLRLPQQDAALLRLTNLETSQLISALNSKALALSGRVNGAFPLWLTDSRWLIQHGWLSNPSALTLRMDADLINGMVQHNGAAASAINWLRYLEINPRSWISINLDKQGKLWMNASIQGTGEVSGKRGSVRLNYHHEDNIFALWRNLRFGDDLQSWLAQQRLLPENCCQYPEKRGKQ